MLRCLFFGVVFFYISTGHAQYTISPLNPEHSQLVQAHQAKNELSKPTGFQPYLVNMSTLDSIFDADTDNWTRREYENWILRKLKNEHLFEVHTKDFHLQGDAAFNLEGSNATDPIGRRQFTNTRGFVFQGLLGERIFFNTSFYETQSIFPNYMDSIASSRGDFNNAKYTERASVPGYGKSKPFITNDGGYDYDYTLTTGTFGVVINSNSFVQFGHDKQFVGYGHRSMFLSDASAPYPFLRAQYSFWKNRITYTTTWALLQTLDRFDLGLTSKKEDPLQRLGARFSYLSFQPSGWFSFGFFDGTTWTWRENSNPMSIEYYSPHAWLYTGTGIRNHIVGINGQVTILKMIQGYGQFGMNTKGRGQAAQVGVKVFGPIPNLLLQLEFNKVGQNLYFYAEDSSGTVFIDEPFRPGTQAIDYYQHNDLILGHPLGVAMDEVYAKLSYRLRDLFANASFNYIKKNSVSNPSTTVFIQAEAGYIINPKSNAQFVLGFIKRDETFISGSAINTTYPYVAFRTNLFNRYMDL